MENILYIVAAVMIIFWIVGFFVYSVGAVIHVLLIVAVVSILFKVFSGNKSV